jgi:hypothetical protein
MHQGWILQSSYFRAIPQVLRSGGKLYDIMNKRRTLRCRTRRRVITIYDPCKVHITDYPFLFRANYIPWQNGLTQIFRGNYGRGVLHSFHLVHHLVEVLVRGLIAWHYCIPFLNNVCHMLHMRKYEVNTTVLWSDDIVNHMSSEILNSYPKANQPQWFQVIIVNVSVYMCFSVGLRSIIPSLATV